MKDSTQEKKNNTEINEIGITPDTLSGRSGLVFFSRYLNKINVLGYLGQMFVSLRKNKKGSSAEAMFRQIILFFIDGTSRHLTWFDQLKGDEGYAAVIETKPEELVSSHAVKRFMKAFSFPLIFLFRRILQKLFLWRLQVQKPEVIKLGIDTMVMDNDDAQKRQGVKPTYKDVKGFQPLQMTWSGKIVDAVFRGGNKHSNDKDTVPKMIEHMVRRIRGEYRSEVPIIIMMDSGFFDQKIFACCESLSVGYVCGGKQYSDIKEYISCHEPQDWTQYGKGKERWEYIEFEDRRESWSLGRRALYCRYVTDKYGQLAFDFARRDTVVYTNLGRQEMLDNQLVSAGQAHLIHSDEIIKMYHERGNDELVHRGLKDFHPEQLPFEKFAPNAAWYYLMVMAFFLYETFKEDVCYPVMSLTSYAQTIRRTLIDIAGKVCRHSGKITLKVTRAVWERLNIPRLWAQSGCPPLFCH